MKKIAGYYRLSMEDDKDKIESNSITNQRQLVKKYIAQDMELCKYEFCEFYDDGYSGTTMNRPGLQEMLTNIKNGEIQIVIVKDISRFSRDYIRLGIYMEQIFPFMGIRFIAITDRYDSGEHTCCTIDMDIAFKGLLADFYCKDVSAKVKSSLETKRKQGKYSTGLVPFGYIKDKDNPYKLLIASEEAEIVRYIFRLSDAGNNLTQICKKLNDEGIMTPLEYKNKRKKQNQKALHREHKFWQAGTVRAILTNETYIGNMVYEKTEQTAVASGKTIIKPRSEWKIFENHHEAIIDKELFAAVQTKFNRRKVAKRKRIEYPLRGKVFCGCCKRTLKVMRLAEGKLSFYCSSERIGSSAGCMSESLSNEKLEGIVLNEIKKQLLVLADKNIILNNVQLKEEKQIKKLEKGMEALQKKIQDLTELKAVYLEQYHAGRLDREQFQKKRNEIVLTMKELKTEYDIKQKEVEQQAKIKAEVSKNDKSLLCYSDMEYLNREMVEAFVEHIEAGGDSEIDIYFTFHKNVTENPHILKAVNISSCKSVTEKV